MSVASQKIQAPLHPICDSTADDKARIQVRPSHASKHLQPTETPLGWGQIRLCGPFGAKTEFLLSKIAQMLGFLAFYLAAATLAGIEAADVIRKEPFGQNGASHFHAVCGSRWKIVSSVTSHPAIEGVFDRTDGHGPSVFWSPKSIFVDLRQLRPAQEN
ncbi:hypothetical protein C8N36_103196 [Pelagimonas varians]|nr:hypothetical protein C8N36_103196 [Pelagimonas varians]